MSRFSLIAIIYNPNSTGSGEDLANSLRAQIAKALPKQKVELHTTEHAGHGFELAFAIAKAETNALIISASGDGGYHDVINGIMKAKTEGAQAVAGLLPAGNANDHFHTMHDREIIKEIVDGGTKTIDLIKLCAVSEGKAFERYAHSYIGIGLTPKVGQQLNKTQLNRLNEIWIVLRVLFVLQPVHILVQGVRRSYDSLIFSNINKMSKVLNLSDDSNTSDGKFEVTTFRRRNKLRLIQSLLKASTTGLQGGRSETAYSFETIKPCLIQVDGEISLLDRRTPVTISIEPAAITCLI